MCLDTVDEKPRWKKGKGWKCFQLTDDKLGPLFPRLVGSFNYPTGEWVKDSKPATFTLRDESLKSRYPTGFHIEKTKKCAGYWVHGPHQVIRRVHFKDVVATGTQSNDPCIVARQIYIEG